MKPTPCMGMNKMNCERVLRRGFFSMRSSRWCSDLCIGQSASRALILKTLGRSDLFDEYSSIVKPREDLLMFDTTFVEIDLVLDKILEVSQTGEFMSAKMVMKQRWVDNRLG